MEAIKTFIFFDLETTGLPQCSPAKVTEIALVAAGREQILEKHDGVTKENIVGNLYLPRVLNKLNFTVYPGKMVHPSASAVSGLTNENLVGQKPFDEGMVNILQLFLDRLEKPVCLVAHNGNKFDFPILKSELIKIGKELTQDLFCVDSLPAFRELLTTQPKCEDEDNNQYNNFSEIRPSDVSSDIRPSDVFSGIRPLEAPTDRAADLVPKCGFSQEEYDEEMIRTLEVSERVAQEAFDNFNIKEIEMKIQLEMDKLRKTNETTPVRKPKQSAAHPMGNHAKRRILNERNPKPRFNLSAVYERVTKKELVNAHRAEIDALALLECVTAIGLPMLEWMDANKIPFRNIKKIW